jgi:hypothetical protein
MVEASSSLKLSRSHLEANVVEGGDRCYGGAMMVMDGSSAVVAETQFVENLARDAIQAGGGAICVKYSSSLDVSNSSLQNNLAIRGSTGSFGGALCVLWDSTCSMRGTELLSNSASGPGELSQGGALFLAYTASVFLVNATVEGNVAERTDVAEGGACYLEDGSSLAVLDSRLCNNSALDGAKQSYGGAISCSGQVTVELVGSRLLDNAASAKGLGASAFGGAVYARTAPSTITVVSCSLRPMLL